MWLQEDVVLLSEDWTSRWLVPLAEAVMDLDWEFFWSSDSSTYTQFLQPDVSQTVKTLFMESVFLSGSIPEKPSRRFWALTGYGGPDQ